MDFGFALAFAFGFTIAGNMVDVEFVLFPFPRVMEVACVCPFPWFFSEGSVVSFTVQKDSSLERSRPIPVGGAARGFALPPGS